MGKMTQTDKIRYRNTAIIIAFLTMLVMFASISCTSQSSKLANIPMEKVVILDSFKPISMDKTNDGKMYKYKVKRITKGVVDIIYEYNQYEAGDTIFHRFKSY
jgi:hypothetical protein